MTWATFLLPLMVLILALAGVAAAESPNPRARTPVAQLPSVRELPNPFMLVDGQPVRTQADWKRRRAELIEMILRDVYGHLPLTTDGVTASESEAGGRDEPNPANGTVRHRTLHMGPGGKITTPLVITSPAGKGPFPAIVTGDLTWGRVKPEIVAQIIGHGYMLAEFDRTRIAPDSPDRSSGVYPLYPNADWGALAAWAWGYGRTIDYLVTRDDVDRDKIVITGHSRGGKATLLAGAIDERVALTVPNGSGCGGAGCFRVDWPTSEDIGAITTHFPYWFVPHFAEFAGRADRLPFDQHELKALVAPRALLTTDSLDDVWANPVGTQASYQASKPVFDFLGAPQKTGLHFRRGPHAQNEEDWSALLEFADWQLAGKRPTHSFDQVPFPELPQAFKWKSPHE